MHRLMLVILVVVLVVVAGHARGQDASPSQPSFPEKTFAADATPGKVFMARSTPAEAHGEKIREGLRYAWRLPADFKDDKSYDLVIVCHGVGVDYRWGVTALDPATFMPSSIVVSVDGPSSLAQGVRAFRPENADIMVFRDFALEMSRTFPADRIFLFGYEQGGAFALAFAGSFPSLTEGVVVQAGTSWDDLDQENENQRKGGVQEIPIAFMHGTADEVTPFWLTQTMQRAYVKEGDELTLLRPLYGCGHSVDAAGVNSCFDWCMAMRTPDPGEALAAAQRLLTLPPAGACQANAAFGGALRILKRFTAGDKEEFVALKDITEVQQRRARELTIKIESLGALHVAALKKEVNGGRDMVLGAGSEGGAWLGHLVTVREDFRGVDSIETYAGSIGFDSEQFDQQGPARSLWYTWKGSSPDKERFETITGLVPHAFLMHGYTPAFFAKMKQWKADAGKLGASEETLESFESVTLLEKSMVTGLERYRKVNAANWK